MSFLGFQVRRGNSVGDGPKVAYALLNETLLPRDAQELPKDLETTGFGLPASHSGTELIFADSLFLPCFTYRLVIFPGQTSQHLAAVRDHLTERNK